jgi:hypothetical protein
VGDLPVTTTTHHLLGDLPVATTTQQPTYTYMCISWHTSCA